MEQSAACLLQQVKNILQVSKCGHMGTLDPMGEGSLPIATGQYTKLIEYFSNSTNQYICDMEFGKTSISFLLVSHFFIGYLCN